MGGQRQDGRQLKQVIVEQVRHHRRGLARPLAPGGPEQDFADAGLRRGLQAAPKLVHLR